MRKIEFFVVLFVSLGALCSCNRSTDTEKYQGKHNNIIDVRAKVMEIPTEDDVLIGGNASLYLLRNKLIIDDGQSVEQQIHIFDRNSFRYLASTAYRGQGPDEITVLGHIGIDEKRNYIGSINECYILLQ